MPWIPAYGATVIIYHTTCLCWWYFLKVGGHSKFHKTAAWLLPVSDQCIYYQNIGGDCTSILWYFSPQKPKSNSLGVILMIMTMINLDMLLLRSGRQSRYFRRLNSLDILKWCWCEQHVVMDRNSRLWDLVKRMFVSELSHDWYLIRTAVKLQNLSWFKTGFVSRNVS